MINSNFIFIDLALNRPWWSIYTIEIGSQYRPGSLPIPNPPEQVFKYLPSLVKKY